MMNLIDWFNEKKKNTGDMIDRGKLWVACSRKRSYVFCVSITYFILLCNYWPYFLRYGTLGFQPFKLFGIIFGCLVGEWLYRCGQYYLMGNPKQLSEKEFQKEGVCVVLGITIACILLIIIQVSIWNCWHVDLSWLTGVGPVQRR